MYEAPELPVLFVPLQLQITDAFKGGWLGRDERARLLLRAASRIYLLLEKSHIFGAWDTGKGENNSPREHVQLFSL